MQQLEQQVELLAAAGRASQQIHWASTDWTRRRPGVDGMVRHQEVRLGPPPRLGSHNKEVRGDKTPPRGDMP